MIKRKRRPDTVLVPRRLLFALASHATALGRERMVQNPANVYGIVENVLMDAAHAKLLLDRQEGKRR